jgi:hypothetical protein
LISRLGAFGLLVREVGAVRDGPVPQAGMLRSGFVIGAGFLVFVLMGQFEAAVICAVFTNFLCLTDRAHSLRSRLWVQGVGAVLSIGAGAVGSLIVGNDPLILVATFAFALFAGFVHGTLPGVEAIPRYAIVCFVAAAYLPVSNGRTLAAVLVGTAFAIIGVRIDDHIRHGARGIRIARINATVRYPGPGFSVTYGAAAVCGLAIGLFWGQARPYWVTITTLLVMQPDRRANTVRVLQRFIGTILGVVGAFVVTLTIPTAARPTVFVTMALLLPFLWPLGFERNYGFGVALLSLWVLLLINFALPAGEMVVPVFLTRLSDTAIGCAVALAGSFVIYEADA